MRPENEWAKLPEDEFAPCANWEIWREHCRRHGEPVERAWLELKTAEEKAEAQRRCPVVQFGVRRAAVFDEPICGAVEEIVDGNRLVSAEVHEIGVHWDSTDKELYDAFKTWVVKQREENPSARHFAKSGGNRRSALSMLVWIAMLRADAAGLSPENATKQLSGLIQKSGCSGRFYVKRYREELHKAEMLFQPVGAATKPTAE